MLSLELGKKFSLSDLKHNASKRLAFRWPFMGARVLHLEKGEDRFDRQLNSLLRRLDSL